MAGLAIRLLLLAAALIAQPVSAQPVSAQPAPALTERANGLVAFWNGEAKAEAIFSRRFLAEAPAIQVEAVAAKLRAELGRARRVARLDPGPPIPTATFEFERGELDVRLAIESEPPGLLSGLLVMATRRKDDSLAQVAADMAALPGTASFAVARLDEDAPFLLASFQPRRSQAVASVFKLFILAELQRQVAARERRWADVVPLTHRSLPSGILQDWPEGSPLTLHSLAALAISQSDNSASDTLLHLLGREKVEAVLPVIGVQAFAANRPFLSTLEAFALKGGDQEAARRWVGAGQEEKRKLLPGLAAVGSERIDLARLQASPNHIDSVEWFASAQDIIRTLDWLRRTGDKDALGILAINPGLPRQAGRTFAYWGYKGGSETGVVAMAFLLRGKTGAWHALAASWNNPHAAVEERRLALLMSRAIALLPE